MTRKTKHHPFFQAGFGIIETIVAVAIFSIIAATGTIAVLHSLSANRLGDEESQANFFATEGIEATRSIRNQGWDDPFLVTDCSSGCGLDSASGSWSWSGSETVQDKFTRVVEVAQAQRDGSDVIVESGGTLDPDTYKVTSTVTWNFSPTRNNTLALTTYIVNWSKLIQSFDFIYAFGGDNTNEFWRHDISGNSWSSMSTAPSNVAGGGALVYDGSSYLYALRGNNKNDFWRYDISANSWSSMTQVASNVKDGGALVYDGSSYIYAFGGNNTNEFWRYDISGNSWSSMATALGNVAEGGALVIGKGVEINTPTPTVGPTATPGSTPVPTATSAPVPTSCTQVCAQAGYSVGSCRKDSKKCSSQGEVNVAAGDQFCTGGKNADTCCCQ